MNIYELMDSVERFGFFITVHERECGKFDVVFGRLDMSAGETVSRNVDGAILHELVQALVQAARVARG